MESKDILKYLRMVGEELQKEGKCGDIVLAGGAVMLLVVKSRQMTKVVSAYLGENPDAVRKAARRLNTAFGLL
ncbi:hypothetical protein [Kyrpidia tusciae]|uniref:Uncharacterized protein n=1 Tax=Kyrpidia tusciae (strain DSM 2912 / NBRC 15312 / T2) TaxID=562970 RepID=D5WT25_KYRT2|nr:hypothetical protein [Kyrpidia tusciae]ADG05129.1 conserved hypothetical protein [Kyrpidia tusciae DSM 2912]